MVSGNIGFLGWGRLTLRVGIIRLRKLALLIVSEPVDILAAEAGVLATWWCGSGLWTDARAHLGLVAASALESLQFIASLPSELPFILKLGWIF